jgi:hypothetical protein
MFHSRRRNAQGVYLGNYLEAIAKLVADEVRRRGCMPAIRLISFRRCCQICEAIPVPLHPAVKTRRYKRDVSRFDAMNQLR